MQHRPSNIRPKSLLAEVLCRGREECGGTGWKGEWGSGGRGEWGGGRMILPAGVYRGRIIIPGTKKWITVEIVGESVPAPVFGTISSFPLQNGGTIVGGFAALSNGAQIDGSVFEGDSLAQITDGTVNNTQGMISENAFDLSDDRLTYTATWLPRRAAWSDGG